MEINRQREEMTLMNNYPCLFGSQIPLANGDWKTRAVLSAATRQPSAPEHPPNTRAFTAEKAWNNKGHPPAVPSLATASLWLWKPLRESASAEGAQESGPDVWLDPSLVLLLAVHSMSLQTFQTPQFGGADVWCETLNTISFSSVLNSTMAPARDTVKWAVTI